MIAIHVTPQPDIHSFVNEETRGNIEHTLRRCGGLSPTKSQRPITQAEITRFDTKQRKYQ